MEARMTHGRTIVLLPKTVSTEQVPNSVHDAMAGYLETEFEYYDMVSIDDMETIYETETLPDDTEAEAVITPDGKWHNMYDYIDEWDSNWWRRFLADYPNLRAIVVYTSF
jgi:hypothetical protein